MGKAILSDFSWLSIKYSSVDLIVFIFIFQKELPEGLNMERLQAILKGYHEYPAKYR